MRTATAASRVKIVLALFLLATLLVAPARPALAAQGLEALAGVVGGVPSGAFAAANIPGLCSTYGSPPTILDFFGSALTVSIPIGRYTAEVRTAAIEVVINAARALSLQLGWRPPTQPR